MDKDTGMTEAPSGAKAPLRRRFFGFPATRLGWWGFGLCAATGLLPLMAGLINRLLTSLSGGIQTAVALFGLLIVLCGATGGIIALVALIRNHERSILVWGSALIGLFYLLFIGGELVFPH